MWPAAVAHLGLGVRARPHGPWIDARTYTELPPIVAAWARLWLMLL